jgi:hypothetical protein
MLWSETAEFPGPDHNPDVADSKTVYSLVGFGQGIYTIIRRFVIIRVNPKQHLLEAW